MASQCGPKWSQSGVLIRPGATALTSSSGFTRVRDSRPLRVLHSLRPTHSLIHSFPRGITKRSGWTPGRGTIATVFVSNMGSSQNLLELVR